jgi:predicted amidohydrolase
MNFTLVQYSPLWEDVENNKKKLEVLLKENKPEPGVIIFPEMSLTGFTMRPESFAESLEGESIKYFKEISRRYSSSVIAGVILTENDSFFNTIIHLDKTGELIKVYKKIHPFSFGDENKHYKAGSEIVITEIEGIKSGLSICYDLRFPELYRYYGKEKVDLIINIANWPITRIHHWRVLLRARAIENLCYVIGVNRVGTDPKLTYNGYTSVFDPMGEEMLCNINDEKISSLELSFSTVREVRDRFPFLNDIKLI